MKKALRAACEHCSGPMPTTGRFRRFCSERCSDAAYRAAHQAERSAYSVQWQRDNRERSRATKTRYADANRDKLNAKAREVSAQPGVGARRWERRQERLGRDVALAEIRANSLWRRYGITPEQYDERVREQDGRCALCGIPVEENKPHRNLAVDHDHACCPGRKSCGSCLRGLLCHTCNVRLGVVEDTEWMRLAQAYLDRYRLHVRV